MTFPYNIKMSPSARRLTVRFGMLSAGTMVGQQGVAAPVGGRCWDSCALYSQLLHHCVNSSLLL
jgi:hypothetical protein